MCRSAKLIQKNWKPDFGDYFVSMSSGRTSACLTLGSALEKKISYLTKIKAVWILRQDQLQKMIIGKYATPWDLAIAFSNVLISDDSSYFDNLDSMEKLWLAFVMLDKHRKKWNGGEWV